MTTRSERIEAALRETAQGVDRHDGLLCWCPSPTLAAFNRKHPEYPSGGKHPETNGHLPFCGKMRAALAPESAPEPDAGHSLKNVCLYVMSRKDLREGPHGEHLLRFCREGGQGPSILRDAPSPSSPADDAPQVTCGGCGNTANLVRGPDGFWRLSSHEGGECFSSGTFDYTGHDQPGGRLPPHDPPPADDAPGRGGQPMTFGVHPAGPKSAESEAAIRDLVGAASRMLKKCPHDECPKEGCLNGVTDWPPSSTGGSEGQSTQSAPSPGQAGGKGES